ncbi:MAG TPA: hypothetical protein VHG71_10885 [Verrucomicrobiae bacterium]|nr:hypothetical protein [Verrucomicrobiae bacterium]
MIMNLGKLLAAGKSIKNGRGAVLYRESKRVYLPKFISPKNPFNNVAKPESAESASAQTVDLPVLEKSAAPTPKTPPISAKPARAAAWIEKFNPVSIWHGAEEKKKIPPQPVQAELSLEKVKVVHNDLTDVDVEVVPIKSRTTNPVPEPAFSSIVSAETGKNFWNRLDEKFFGTNAA